MTVTVHDVPNRALTLLHPKAVNAFTGLNTDLIELYETGKTRARYHLFEGYRSPERQAHLLSRKTTKAAPWQSAHQYGLACDFVPYLDGVWTWTQYEGMTEDRAQFTTALAKRGLWAPISWDPYHVEHPLWEKLSTWLLK